MSTYVYIVEIYKGRGVFDPQPSQGAALTQLVAVHSAFGQRLSHAGIITSNWKKRVCNI